YEQDLNEIVDYIVFKLHNPDGAMNLVKRIENAIVERLNWSLSFELFQSNRKRKNQLQTPFPILDSLSLQSY
ncbi:MAG: hypothetical protein WA125_10295, partial [Desulfosporosinus sp.]